MTKEKAGLKKEIMRNLIQFQAAAVDPEGPGRILNFIAYAENGTPIEIQKFKSKLSAKLRAKIILPAPVKQFDPNKLITAQRNVIANNLLHFFQHEEKTQAPITHKHYGEILPIVARCKDGYYIYDGNHRACINLLAGRQHRAKCIDLRDIDGIIKRLKRKA